MSAVTRLLVRSVSTIPSQQVALLSTTSAQCNCNRSGFARVRGRQYLRLYPTLLVNPDGSTITIRYKEPREIIKKGSPQMVEMASGIRPQTIRHFGLIVGQTVFIFLKPQLPLDLTEVDEATRSERLALRKRSKKVELEDDQFDDTFDTRQYKFLLKDKKQMGKKN